MNLHIELDTSHPAYEWLAKATTRSVRKDISALTGSITLSGIRCEAAGCYVIENIRIAPGEIDEIQTIRVNFDLAYPSTGKPCTSYSLELMDDKFRYRLSGNQKIEIAQNLIDIMEKGSG